MSTFTATYSPEDNKLRLYASERLDPELYNTVKDHGFKWAPMQKLFVAPKWTPGREDLCIELAGEIHAEESTMVERAELKALRLENLATKRGNQSDAYSNAAHAIGERFASGQPILIGHHSQRKAERDQAKMKQAQAQAQKCSDAVQYWNWKAEGVERHANMKSNPRTRANRIKTLLADLRDAQRQINHGFVVMDIWDKIDAIEDSEKRTNAIGTYAGARLEGGQCTPRNYYDAFKNDEMSEREIIEGAHAYGHAITNSLSLARWVSHTLNRLAYEQSELCITPRYEDELTPVILQLFARTHGAAKPKAKKEGEQFTLTSPVPLPVHLGDGESITLSADAWRDLMQSVGFVVEVKVKRPGKKQVCSLLNPTPEDAEKLQQLWNAHAAQRKYGVTSERDECTQKYYSYNSQGSYGILEAINVDEHGAKIWGGYNCKNNTPVFRVRVKHGGKLYSADRVMTITDKKQHAIPLDLDQLLADALLANAEAYAAAAKDEAA